MMETGKLATPAKKTLMTPKAIIHQRFGDKACYKVEEVLGSAEDICPGLAIPQKGPCFYRCTLQLPETVVVSDTFRKKKDAEQSAAEKAIEKLRIRQNEYNPSVQEACDDLADRLTFLFGNEFLSFLHPLSGHFRAALRREGHFKGCVPVSVIAAYDAKISNICKYINPMAASNSLLVMSLIRRVGKKLTNSVRFSDEQLSLQRRNQYPLEIIASSLNHELDASESISITVIRIPASLDKAVEYSTLNFAATGYYLDAIAQELGLAEASEVLISRTIGKASSEMRIFYSAPKPHILDQLSEPLLKPASQSEGSLNARATYFCGQEVHGDAILASVGYIWKDTKLSKEDVCLRTYYRILINMMPSGAYLISRDAILAAKLPLMFTTRSNWRGSLPRDILCAFCRSHHLSEPVISTESILSNTSGDLNGSHKKVKVIESDKEEKKEAALRDPGKNNEAFNCEVKIISKSQELILHCSPQESYKKQTDAIQSTALKVLSWLNIYFEEPDSCLEKMNALSEKFGIRFTPSCFFKEFELCRSVHELGNTKDLSCKVVNFNGTDNAKEYGPSCGFGGQNSGITLSNGSLACIHYSVSLVTEGGSVKELIESNEEFVFEIGSEAVLPHLEAAVTQLAVGQSAHFRMELPPPEFILAAASNSASTISLLSSRGCTLEYNVTLLRVTEPLEERMEQAFFSPPLSKQRVDFALQHIKESSAVSLVDFGCGSGSLLDGLLLCHTFSLEKIVGVDISQRSLARAAKSLHSKLNRLLDPKEPSSGLKSVVLYDGSITQFDSRLHEFDIATCLEVIEHVEEEDACLFGDAVLSSFCPKILIVSTPNYEYNAILQRCTPQSLEEEDPEEKNQPQICKFRNLDHKFEWTRAQFNHWASELAKRHNYSVEFSGVGGAADVEPGFASQIAIFRRGNNYDRSKSIEAAHHYATIWEWSREDVVPKEAYNILSCSLMK